MNKSRIFDERRSGTPHRVVLPWRRTLQMCAMSVKHRMGRSALTFICVAVVVAFFSSSLSYQCIVERLSTSTDVHTRAVLEKAGISVEDGNALQKQRDQRIWLMTLSGALCLVGITNTILMSVTERVREIGTLKCLGALDSFVVRLFLIESLFIGSLGSICGAVFGYLLSLLQVGSGIEFALLTFPIAGRAFLLSVPISALIGAVVTMCAAVYPIYVAARMKPVEAMRAEV